MKTKFLKNILLVSITFGMFFSPCLALELDFSVDEEIRKNYNPSKLEQQNLPPLPKTTGIQSKTVTTQPKSSTTTAVPPKTAPIVSEPAGKKVNKNLSGSTLTQDDFTAIKIKKGSKFRVKSNAVVSDYLREGAKVSFTSLTPVYQKYITIPAGAVLRASVKDVHQPQLTGNGGLVVLVLESVSFNGKTYSAHGKVTKANHKKIFMNNIKGKRQYWNGVSNQIDKGESFYKKTRKTSSKLANNPIGVIISPIPTIIGIATYGVNLVLSPVISIGHKGERISIPAGSEFEFKVQENIYLGL